MQPTIDLTCCCKKDLEVNFKVILSLFFFIEIFSIVLIGDFAPQDDALNVHHLLLPVVFIWQRSNINYSNKDFTW